MLLRGLLNSDDWADAAADDDDATDYFASSSEGRDDRITSNSGLLYMYSASQG